MEPGDRPNGGNGRGGQPRQTILGADLLEANTRTNGYERKHSVEIFEDRSEVASQVSNLFEESFEELAEGLMNDDPEINERSFRSVDADGIMQQYLEKMEKEGYDFYFKNEISHNDKSFNARRFLRKAVMYFECQNKQCPTYQKGGKAKIWVSHYGLIFITYKFVDFVYKSQESEYTVTMNQDNKIKVTEREDYLYVLKYNIKLYAQRCQSCFGMVAGKIYETQMEIISMMFCNILDKILKTEKDPVARPNKHRHENDVEGSKGGYRTTGPHFAQDCEACQEGYCKKKSYQEYKDAKKSDRNMRNLQNGNFKKRKRARR